MIHPLKEERRSSNDAYMLTTSSIVKEKSRRDALRAKIKKDKSNEGSHWTFD